MSFGSRKLWLEDWLMMEMSRMFGEVYQLETLLRMLTWTENF
jgi:hypothetical protein